MPDPIKRAEKVHIDELSGKATSTVCSGLMSPDTSIGG